ncbi:MAG TPA: hypothetical protein VJ855_01915 [Marinilabiliaceae bacterium]|nr:hypothetical protein [Marinilabiliaceae bacterium]
MNAIQTSFMMLLLIILSSSIAAQENHQRFYTTENVEIPLQRNTKIFINNQYGDINFTGWDQDSIAINVSIWVEAPNQQMADEVSGQISIINQTSAGTVSYKTVFTNSFFSNYTFGIDYTLFAPHNLKLELHNRFGDIYLHQFGSELIAEIEYGNLTSQKQSDPIIGGNLSVMNGDLSMETIQNIKVVHKNGDLFILQADRTSFLLDFSKGIIETGNFIEINAKTSRLLLKNSRDMTAYISASTLIVDELSQGKFIESSAKSKVEIKKLMPYEKEITFINNNSNLDLGISKKLSYNLHGELTNGQLHHYQNDSIKKIRDINSTSFSGNFECDGISPASLIIFGENGVINIYQSEKE